VALKSKFFSDVKDEGSRLQTNMHWMQMVLQPNQQVHSFIVVWGWVSQFCLLSSHHLQQFTDLIHSHYQPIQPISFHHLNSFLLLCCQLPVPAFQLASSNLAVVLLFPDCQHQLCSLYSTQCFLVHPFVLQLMCAQFHLVNLMFLQQLILNFNLNL
jgi:hypothetical protein